MPGLHLPGLTPADDWDSAGGEVATKQDQTTGKNKHNAPGTLAMARSNPPDSASSQFYITLGAAPHLDGKYATFGKITDGLDAATSLREGDRMKSVTIEGGE